MKEKHLHQRGKLGIRKDCFQMLNMDAWQSVHELEDQIRKLIISFFKYCQVRKSIYFNNNFINMANKM